VQPAIVTSGGADGNQIHSGGAYWIERRTFVLAWSPTASVGHPPSPHGHRRPRGDSGRHRLLPSARPLEQLDGPEGVVGEVGPAAGGLKEAAGAGGRSECGQKPVRKRAFCEEGEFRLNSGARPYSSMDIKII
jgi:hypothetical protein